MKKVKKWVLTVAKTYGKIGKVYKNL